MMKAWSRGRFLLAGLEFQQCYLRGRRQVILIDVQFGLRRSLLHTEFPQEILNRVEFPLEKGGLVVHGQHYPGFYLAYQG